MQKPSTDQLAAYQAAFDYFNARLFAGELQDVMLTFSRHAGALGFFAPDRWAPADSPIDKRTHEISLNPTHLFARTEIQTASTLVHEMVHLWQQLHGKPGRKGYHNTQWAEKMRAVGLVPSATGEPGGKPIGARMTHYVDPGGVFERAFAKRPPACRLPFGCDDGHGPAKKKDPSKVKFTCGECGASAWGKATLRIACVECDRPMLSEEQDDDDRAVDDDTEGD